MNLRGKLLSAGEANETLAGENTDAVCASSIQKMLLPAAETETETGTEELADTGADSGVITLVVLALMMLIGGSVLVNRVNN
jgi:LPXTG-motif cell wall-anchored protein